MGEEDSDFRWIGEELRLQAKRLDELSKSYYTQNVLVLQANPRAGFEECGYRDHL